MTTPTIWRGPRGALARMVLVGVIALGSPALAQEAAPGAAPEAAAWPLSPPSSWEPVFGRASRSGVIVSPHFALRDQGEQALRVQVYNQNPFPVRVEGLVLRAPRGRALYQGEPLTLAPSSGVELALAPLRKEEAPPELWAAMAEVRARFSLRLEAGAAQTAALVREALSREDQEISATTLFDLAQTATRGGRLLVEEARLRRQHGLPWEEVEAEAEAWSSSAPWLQEAALAQLDRDLVGEGSGGTLGWLLALGLYDKLLRGEDGPTQGLRLSARAHEMGVAGLKERLGGRALLELARRMELGAETPAAFVPILTEDAARGLARYEEEARGEQTKLEKIPFALFRAYEELHRLDALAPSHPLRGRRGALAELAIETALTRADDRDLRGADYALELVARDLAGLPEGDPTSAGLGLALVDARAQVEFERGQFLFHYRRGDAAEAARAWEAFERSKASAPVRARLYQAGLVLTRHQGLSLLGALLLALGVVAASRSGAASRWRLRGALWWASLRRRGAGERAWGLLSELQRLDPGRGAEARLRARGAAWLLEGQDRHLLREAAALMAPTAPSARPSPWRGPLAPLRALAAQVDEAREVVDVVALQARAQALGEVFGGAAALAGAALAAEAACREAARRGAGGDAALLEASRAWLSALEARPGAAMEPWARVRAGLLWAEVGPALLGAEVAWAQSHALLRGQVVMEHGEEPSRVAAAAVMAAAAAGSTQEAVLALREGEEALRAHPEEAQVVRAALLTAASRAGLPMAAPGLEAAAARAQILRQQEALSGLDDLLAARLGAQEGLSARLRVALLRRLSGAASGTLSGDEEYARDREALFALARARRDDPVAVALAAALDLLTEGDWGFDAEVTAAQGEARASLGLLEALDHFAGGRVLEAAQGLLSLPAEGGGGRAARVWAARAVVGASLGQHRAAREALGRAVEASSGAGAEAQAAVDRVASRLLGSILEGGALRAGLLERASLGWLGRVDQRPPVRWGALARLLLEEGSVEALVFLLQRADAEGEWEGDAAGRVALSHGVARRALAEGDYTRARLCVILGGGGNEHRLTA